MNVPYTSSVITVSNYRTCVSGSNGKYRYTVFCPDGSTVVKDNFSRALDAHKEALRQAVSIQTQKKKTPRQFP